MAIEWWKIFSPRGGATGTKSTALSELRVLIGFLLFAAVWAGTHGSIWLPIVFIVILFPCIALYLHLYWKFAEKDPNLLRTEHYNIALKRLEQSNHGDDARGFVEGEKVQELPAPTEKGDDQ